MDADLGLDYGVYEGAEPGEGDAANANPATSNDRDAFAREWRKRSLHVQNSVNGSTGTLHLSEAGSGAPGTFRLSVLTSIFSANGFLCDTNNPCPSAFGESVDASDGVDQVSAHLALSVTLLPFLEVFAGVHNKATATNRSRPQLLQVLGDTNLGVKAFTPSRPDRLLSFGGEAELWLLNGTGGVGLDGGGTSFALRGLATLDATNRTNAADRSPVRAHLNLGYRFDNSANLVEDLEENAPPVGRGARISRIERLGLGINRVDFLEIGLGSELVHSIVRPFLEWSIDIPLNRQDYVCNIDQAMARGESCLQLEEGIAVAPSRLTLGARLYPWKDHGLAISAAFDVGTSGTSTFIEEVAPQVPWNLWLGLAYAVDTVAPQPIVQRVAAPAPAAAPIEHYIEGVVLEKGTQTPVPDAVIRYDGRDITGMVTGELGAFRTTQLAPGTYTFNVTAPGYRDGQCAATIQNDPPRQPANAPRRPLPPQPTRPGAASAAKPGEVVVPLQCELEALPRVGNIIGSLADSETNQVVGSAQIKITDRLNRELNLTGDASGSFRFENIPPGRVKLTIEAPGYLTSVTELSVKAREDLQARIALNKRPAQPNVTVQGREVRLRRQVHFGNDSAELLPDSMSLLEEIADVLKSRAEIQKIEVQGHTDDTGSPLYNERLSQSRAQAVVDALIRLGVDPLRLSAKGYGQDKPLLPNSSEPNRARNRRVQLMIQ